MHSFTLNKANDVVFKCFISRSQLFLVVCILFVPLLAANGSFTHEVRPAVTGTPVVWGKPLAGGPIRTLFVAPRFTLGDVAQLAARLDMRHETVALWSAHSIGYDPTAYPVLPDGGSRDEILQRLHEKLAEYQDVIVLANFDTDILPEEMFSAILDKVASGTGLLIVHARNGANSALPVVLDALTPDTTCPPLSQGTGACLFPGQDSSGEIGQIYVHGRGRIILLTYLGDPPDNHCLIQPPVEPLDMDAFYEDNAYSFVARAVCAAAGRQAGSIIASLQDQAPKGPQEDEIPPDFYPEFVQAMKDSVVAQPARPFQINFAKPTEEHYTVSAQLRRAASNVLISWHDPEMLPKGTTAHQFEIPVGSGNYTLDVWLHDRAGIVDWYSQDFSLSGWPEFHDLKVEKTWLLPNDSLEIKLEVRPVVNHTRQATIYARAVDGYERVVSETAVEVDYQGGAVQLRLHFTDLLSTLVKVEVFALEGKRHQYSEWELHSAFRDVRYLSVRQKTEFNTLDVVGSMGRLQEYMPLYYMKCLAELGMNWIHAPGDEAMIVSAARQHLNFLPQVDGKAEAPLQDSKFREPCLSNPAFRNENKDSLRDTTLRHWAGGFGRYSLGNGNCVASISPLICQCRHCMGRFQEMLSQEYGDINDLNQAWQQNFGDWDFVELPPAFGPGEKGPHAPWIDFRRCMDTAFAEYNGWARQIVQRTDRGAFVGACFSTDENSAKGYHWPLLFDTLDFVACNYSPIMTAKARSYSKKHGWAGIVLEDQRALPTGCAAWLPWKLLSENIHALWFNDIFGNADDPSPDAWILPDGCASETLQTMLQTCKEINDTVAPLIYAAERETAAVAIYDSHASRHLAAVDRTYGKTLQDAQEAATAMLSLAGIHFDFIDKTRLLDATPMQYRAIFLPFCRALDADELESLKRYVQYGGALIADFPPGDYDAHGCLQASYPLEELFGIRITGVPVVKTGTLKLNVENNAVSGNVPVNTSVALGNGIALSEAEGTPAWITNRMDTGHTFLLNHPFRQIVTKARQRFVPPEYNAIKTFITDLPGVKLDKHYENFLGSVNRYKYGTADIFFVLPDPDAERQELRLPIDGDAAAYNMFTSELIRRPHKKRFQTINSQPLFISVLPQSIKNIVVNVPEVIHVGTLLPIQVLITTSKQRAGKHLLIADLIPLNGTPIPYYRRVITAENGVGETFMPLAFNEILGKYSLRVRDILSGIETVRPIALSSPAS